MLALLPLYMLAMMLVAVIGLVGSLVMFIPLMIQPKLIVPFQSALMERFSTMFASIVVRRIKS